MCTAPIKDEYMRFATTSEDQTVKVWRYNLEVDETPTLLSTLRGHKKAVTAVGWTHMKTSDGSLQETLVTCSDDKHL